MQVDPRKLAANGASLDQVMETTATRSTPACFSSRRRSVGTGGFVEGNGQRLNVRNVQPIVSANDLAQVPIERRDGETLRLSDVGHVVEDTMPLGATRSSTVPA